MKVKMYILTYDCEFNINDNLNSLFSSNIDDNLEINIINNHTILKISEENKKRLNDFGNYKIFNNVMQCDWSWGYSTRNWNQALILGFKSLNNPDCDLVVCAQDDTNYETDWLSTLKQRHNEGLEFIACGAGDCFCSYTPNAVKSIGLWDERMCTLNYTEFDYFLRAASWLGYKAAIDDNNGVHIGWDGTSQLSFNKEKTVGIARNASSQGNTSDGLSKLDLKNIRQSTGDSLGTEVFKHKWGENPCSPGVKVSNNVGNCRVPITPMFVNYPYFEKDIPDIRQKGYLFL